MRYAHCVSVLALATVALATKANAQTVEATSGSPADTGGTIQEIIVTAQKRSERIQDVPVPITALDGATLAKTGVSQLDQVARLAPGVNIGVFTSTKPTLYIRGIGTRQIDIGSDPSVGVFIDDVYAGRSSALVTGLNDIDRIEILKGPQGTLYGRNTIGGAISIVTPQPTSTFQGNVEVGGGNIGSLFAHGYVSGPIIDDKLDARLSVSTARRDGYVRNLATGRDAMGLKQSSARLKLRYRPTDAITATLTLGAFSDHSAGQQGKSEGPDTFFRSPALPPAPITPDPLSDYYSSDSPTDRQERSASLRVEVDLRSVMLTSITAYQHGSLFEDADVDSTRYAINQQTTREHSSEFSQELRLTSAREGALSLGGKLNWILGAYFYHDKATRLDSFTWGADSLPVFVANYFGAPLSAVRDDTTLAKSTNSYALFGQATYRLTDKLEVTAGLRWSRDEKDGVETGSASPQGLPPLFADFSVPVRKSWESLDPRLTLSWKPQHDTMIYATFATGYKSGGFQWAVVDPSFAARIFDPEKVSYYEIGTKTQWFDRKLTINLSAFYNDYSKLQLQRLVALPSGGVSEVIDNVGASKIKGIEIEGVLRLYPGLSINAAYAYLDAQYDNYVPGFGEDFSHTRMVRAPKNVFNVAGEYQWSLGGDWGAILRADMAYTSGYYFEPGENQISPTNWQASYTLVNALAGVRRGRWHLNAFVNNLTNKTYKSAHLYYPATATPFGTIGGQGIAYYALPRTFGARLAVDF